MPAATSSMLVPDWVLVTTILSPSHSAAALTIVLIPFKAASPTIIPVRSDSNRFAPTRERDPPVTGVHRQPNCCSTGNGYPIFMIAVAFAWIGASVALFAIEPLRRHWLETIRGVSVLALGSCVNPVLPINKSRFTSWPHQQRSQLGRRRHHHVMSGFDGYVRPTLIPLNAFMCSGKRNISWFDCGDVGAPQAGVSVIFESDLSEVCLQRHRS